MSANKPDAVKQIYGAVARGNLSNEHQGVRAIATAFGYSPAELLAVPAEANMGLSCGNPTATANLKPGEVVLDLGSGGGLDVFLAAKKVGPTGRAIGVDMTPEMIDRARRNAHGYTNVEFHLGSIEHLPLADASVDVVISNCVINLSENKPAVFREIARVLKPGGRVAISDIVLQKDLPPALAGSVAAWCGCIAGAIRIDQFITGLTDAGLTDVLAIADQSDLNAYAKVEGQAGCCAPSAETSGLPIINSDACCSAAPETAMHNVLTDLLREYDINEYAASVKFYAVKPHA